MTRPLSARTPSGLTVCVPCSSVVSEVMMCLVLWSRELRCPRLPLYLAVMATRPETLILRASTSIRPGDCGSDACSHGRQFRPQVRQIMLTADFNEMPRYFSVVSFTVSQGGSREAELIVTYAKPLMGFRFAANSSSTVSTRGCSRFSSRLVAGSKAQNSPRVFCAPWTICHMAG